MEARAVQVAPESADVEIKVYSPAAAIFEQSEEQAILYHVFNPPLVRVLHVAPESAEV
jgi:hypothetical protein